MISTCFGQLQEQTPGVLNSVSIIGVEIEQPFISQADVFAGGILKVSTHWRLGYPDWGYDELSSKLAGFETGDLYITIKTYDPEQLSTEYWEPFKDFCQSIIDRYMPKAISILNEPDSPSGYMSTWGNLFGAWGFSYSAGYWYGKLCRYIYNRTQHPDTLCVVGELQQPNSDFVRGMNDPDGIRGKFDLIGLHDHVTYPNPTHFNERVQAIRDIFGQDTKVIMSECSPISDEDSDHYKAYQVAYLERINSKLTNEIYPLSGWIWYCLSRNGWKHSDLCDKDDEGNNSKRPVWYKYEEIVS